MKIPHYHEVYNAIGPRPNRRGTAIYLCSRITNGFLYTPKRAHWSSKKDVATYFRIHANRVKPETAARWAKHIDEGGALKVISRTVEQQREFENANRKRTRKFQTEYSRFEENFWRRHGGRKNWTRELCDKLNREWTAR